MMPTSIELRFLPLRRGDHVKVMIVDRATGHGLICYPLRWLHNWLTSHGYRWVAGSNGVWVRS